MTDPEVLRYKVRVRKRNPDSSQWEDAMVMVEISIDWEWMVRQLAQRAANNKAQKTSIAAEAVKVKVIAPTH